MAEVDFPRGKPVKKEVAEKKVKGGNKTKNAPAKQNKSKEPRAVPSVNKFLLTQEAFHKDVLVLGCVNELRKDEIVVELPNNFKGVVQGEGAKFATVGQVLSVGVTQAKGNGPISLTLASSVLNQGLTKADIRPGMYISGVVSSVEDRGYTVNTSIPSTTAFIKTSKSRLVAGQPVLSVVESVDESGHLFLIPLTSDGEAAFSEVRNWKSVSMLHVRPGNAVKAKVIHKFPTGLSVRIYNQPATSSLSVFIPVAHLHKPLESYDTGFRVSGRVIFADYRAQLVIVSTLPHLVNQRAPTALANEYENLRGLVFPITAPTSSRPVCTLPTIPPAQAIVTANSNQPEVTDVESVNDAKKQVDVKVTGVSYLLGALEVSADPDVVDNENATLSTKDLYPGMLITGSVSDISTTGIDVKISPLVTGKCGMLHLTDAPSVQKVGTFFSENQLVQSRVLSIDEDQTVYITNKPTLVNSSLRIISSYHHAMPGVVAHGWVSKVTKSEVTVSFYDNVTGFVPSADIEGSPSDSYHVGEVVTCQVVECSDADAKGSYKLLLTFDVQLARPVPQPPAITKVRQAFSSATIGDRVSGVVSHSDTNGLTLVLDSGVTAVLPTQHLSDHHAICTTLLTRYYMGTQMTDLVVLNKDSSNMRLVLSNKASLRLCPVKYDDIKVGDVIPGHIKQISDSTYTVGFLGTWKAIVARKPQSRVTYVLGQSVRALVTEVLGNGVLNVDLESDSTKTNGVPLLLEYFKGIDGVWSRSKIAKAYHIGAITSGKVVEHRGAGQVAVLLDNNVVALAQEPVNEYPLGKTVKGVVIDLDYTSAIVHLCLKKEIVDNIVKPTVGKEMLGTVLHYTPAYLVVSVTPTSGSRAIVYAPLVDYNTQGLGKEHFTNLFPGSTVQVVASEGDESKSRPVVAIKDSNTSLAKQVKVVDEDSDAAEDADTSMASVDTSGFLDEDGDEDGGRVGAGSVFQYAADSDDEDDPDRDDLQAYMARVAKAKGLEAASQEKKGAKAKVETKETKTEPKKTEPKTAKRKPITKQVSNKKMKTKK